MSKKKKKCCCRSVIYRSVVLFVCGTILFAAGSKCRAQFASSALAADWLDKATRDVSPLEAALLKRSQATLMRNVITGDAWKPYRGVMPSLGSYRGIWNWDSAFHAVGISHWDPELAREQFKILFGKQLPSGALPDVIWEKRGMVTTFTKPPVLAWAVAVSGSYAMNTKVTFGRETGGAFSWKHYLRFAASGVLGVIVATTTLVILSQYTDVFVAKFISILAAFGVNFSMSHFVVFRAVPSNRKRL